MHKRKHTHHNKCHPLLTWSHYWTKGRIPPPPSPLLLSQYLPLGPPDSLPLYVPRETLHFVRLNQRTNTRGSRITQPPRHKQSRGPMFPSIRYTLLPILVAPNILPPPLVHKQIEIDTTLESRSVITIFSSETPPFIKYKNTLKELYLTKCEKTNK